MKNYHRLEKIISSWKRRKNRLIVVAGRRKSGKDVLIKHILRHYPGFQRYRIAEGPNKVAKVLDLPPDRRIQHALFGVNALLRPILGESAYKRRVARLLDMERPKYALVDAIRTREEYEEFIKKRKGILLAVVADDKSRYARALADYSRGRKEKRDEGRMSFKDFMRKENSPIERDIDWIVKKAHFVLENNFWQKKQVYQKVDTVMKQLGFKKLR